MAKRTTLLAFLLSILTAGCFMNQKSATQEQSNQNLLPPDLKGTLIVAPLSKITSDGTLPISLVKFNGLTSSLENIAATGFDSKLFSSAGYPAIMDEHLLLKSIAKQDEDSGRGAVYESPKFVRDTNVLTFTPVAKRVSIFSEITRLKNNSYVYYNQEPWSGSNAGLYNVINGNVSIISQGVEANRFSVSGNSVYFAEGNTQVDWPQIFSFNNLDGKKNLHVAGYGPQINPAGTLLAFFAPRPNTDSRESKFGVDTATKLSVQLYDVAAQKSLSVLNFSNSFPSMVWTENGANLIIIKNSYSYSLMQTRCVVTIYNTELGKIQKEIVLTQKGSATVDSPEEFIPNFSLIGIDNSKYLILQVEEDFDDVKILSLNLTSGIKNDLYKVESKDTTHLPIATWIGN